MRETTADESLRVALDLFDTGVALMLENLRRQYPQADEDELTRRLAAWLRDRPGAEAGDGDGRPVDPRVRFG
jgi:Rv0078B-related antitoxin